MNNHPILDKKYNENEVYSIIKENNQKSIKNKSNFNVNNLYESQFDCFFSKSFKKRNFNSNLNDKIEEDDNFKIRKFIIKPKLDRLRNEFEKMNFKGE